MKWAHDHSEELRISVPRIPSELQRASDRAVDIWRCLFAISDLAGGTWPERARSAAIALSTGPANVPADTLGVELLRDLKAIYYPEHAHEAPSDDVLTVTALHTRLVNMVESPWPTLDA